jgi:prophage antirepressor-like protein
MNNLQVFNYQGNQEVRTIEKDNEIWFVAKDVCNILGLEQVSRAMDRLDKDEGGLLKIPHP